MTDSTLVTDLLALMSDQFSDSQKLNDLMRCFLRPLDELTQTAEDLRDNRWIDTAIGQQLDELGAIVGVARMGRDDETYRHAIRFQIFINLSKAEPETLIAAVREFTGGTFIRYWEHGSGTGFQIFTNGETIFTDSDDGETRPFALLVFLRSITAAGVDFVSLSYSLGETPLFGFGSEFDVGRLELSNGELLEVDNGDEVTNLQIITGSGGGVSPDGFLGFAEVGPSPLELDTGDWLGVLVDGEIVPLYVDYDGLQYGGGKFVEGVRDYI